MRVSVVLVPCTSASPMCLCPEHIEIRSLENSFSLSFHSERLFYCSVQTFPPLWLSSTCNAPGADLRILFGPGATGSVLDADWNFCAVFLAMPNYSLSQELQIRYLSEKFLDMWDSIPKHTASKKLCNCESQS